LVIPLPMFPKPMKPTLLILFPPHFSFIVAMQLQTAIPLFPVVYLMRISCVISSPS
jgi:hypothetical protein